MKQFKIQTFDKRWRDQTGWTLPDEDRAVILAEHIRKNYHLSGKQLDHKHVRIMCRFTLEDSRDM